MNGGSSVGFEQEHPAAPIDRKPRLIATSQPAPAERHDLLTAAQSAQLCRLSAPQWEELSSRGLVPDPVVIAEQPRWKSAQLRRWLNELITSEQCAQLAQVKKGTWTAYVVRHQAPPCDRNLGRKSLWRRRTVLRWWANRPGRGSRTDMAR